MTADQTTNDPYRDVAYQKEPSRVYAVWPIQVSTLFLCSVITVVVAIGTRSPWAAAGLIPAAYLALTSYRQITCDEQGLIVHYWLMPALHVPWQNIQGLQLSTWNIPAACMVRTSGIRLAGTIYFWIGYPGNPWARIGDADLLVKAILIRAHLTRRRRFLSVLQYAHEKVSIS